MGSIINPAPGDLVDRQTILEIKIEHCGVEGDTPHAPSSDELLEQSPQKSVSRTLLLDKTEIDIQPFLIEHEAIQKKLEHDWFPKLVPFPMHASTRVKDLDSIVDKFDSMHKQIRSVNAELWKLEDQARILRAAPEKFKDTVLKRKAETLDAITSNNDLRASLVKKINALWNISVEEKLYQ